MAEELVGTFSGASEIAIKTVPRAAWLPVARVALRLLGAFALATAAIWVISLYSINTLKPLYLDPDLKLYVHVPGTIHWQWSEGYGKTAFGKHGIAGIADVDAIRGPKIMIWGDSQVEALQVPDDDKVAQQFTRLWSQRRGTPLTGIGVGQSFFSLADYYFQIPRYEAVIGEIKHHFIVVPNLTDVLPDEEGQKTAHFAAQPSYHFEPAPPPEVDYSMVRRMYQMRLQFVTRARTILKTKTASVRLQPGPVHSVKPDVKPFLSPEACEKAWDYALPALRSRTKLPVTFIYIPTVPYVKGSQVIFTPDHDELVQRFEQKCRQYQIGFINMGPAFIAYYKRTRQFPRGFSNSLPWDGHMNSNGHRLVAEEIRAYLEEREHALHAN